jgi:hypothetical protein
MEQVKEGYSHLKSEAQEGYAKAKEFVKSELKTKHARENIQLLITALQILAGFIVGLICKSLFLEFFEANIWIGGISLLICILLPVSSNSTALCSSGILRSSSFWIFSFSIGVTLAFFSLYFEDFFFALWLYMASALLMYYEFNALGLNDVRKGFKFVVFGLLLMTLGIELINLFDLHLMWMLEIVVNN